MNQDIKTRDSMIGPIIIWLLLLCVALTTARGATIVVTEASDSGPGTLRQALADAHDGDTIQFDPLLGGRNLLIAPVLGQLVVNKNVSIIGPGANRLAVDGNHASRVFYIASGKDVAISGLTITNGSAPKFGGGIYNDHATLRLSSCTLSGNSVEHGIGGGIFNDAFSGSATLYVLNCTLSGNSALYGYGGGIGNQSYNGSATLTVSSSTLSGNSAASGGGIYSESRIDGTATLEVLNSTLSGNWATFGGAIYARGDTFDSARLDVLHTTLANNSASSSGGGIYNSGAITQLANTVFNASSIFNASGMIRSLGYNLCSDYGSGFLTATGDQINTDPMLGPLQDNGGPTFTHMLLSGSPAIDSGAPSFDLYSFSPPLLYDQRGDGFPRVVNDLIDIGAFEVSPAPTPTSTPKATPTAKATPTSKATPTPVRTPPASSALIVSPALASITLNPGNLTGGANSTGTVTLSAAAPAGGAVVALKSSNTNAATVLPSVTVPAGATTATFMVTTKTVTAGTIATITATYNGISKSIGLVVNTLLGSLTMKPSVLIGGADSTGTVTLTSAAPAGGAVVTLTSSNLNAATVLPSVTVAAGAKSATFAVKTKTVTAVTQANITATSLGASRIVTLTLNPPLIVSVNPAAVTGPAGSTGTVTLGAAAPAGGAVVTLTSNTPIAATVPPTVTVAANATTVTFAITTKPVAAVTAVIIKAAYNGVAKTATLTVNPAGPAALAGVTMNPATVIYGANSTGTVTLTSAAPAGGAAIALTATNTSGFTVPASVTVPVGATTAQFTVGTYWFPATTTIRATYNGVDKTATLTSVDATVIGLTCAPNPVIAGNPATCTVTMNGIVPSDTPVSVLSDQPFFLPDASGWLTVPAGAVSAAFSITTTLVPAQIVAHISASALATPAVTTPLTINLTNRGRKWNLNNVVFKDGGKASGYFTYDPATGQYLDVNIRVTPGNPPNPNSPLGQSPEDLYYYPWPNGFMPTFVDDWSTASEMALQNPVTNTPVSWTYLQFNFAQPLTNAGGTIPLVVNPNVAYSPYCTEDYSPTCTRPPAQVSQESFALPDNLYGVVPGFYYRVIISGTVTAQ